MTQNILSNIRDYFTEDFKDSLDINLDEPGTGVSKALSAIIPTALVAIVNKSETEINSGNSIFTLANQAASYYSKEPDVAQLQNDEAGSNLPYDIFGENEQNVARHIAAYSGIRPGSVSTLMVLAVPVIMGKLGELAQNGHLSAGEFSSAILNYKEGIHQMIPDGYTLPDLDGAILTAKEDKNKINETAAARRANYVMPRWVPILVVVIVVALLIYFSRM